MKPYIVVEWNDTETEAKGWLCIHNLIKGYCSGGLRMHPNVSKQEVMKLAEGMAYKYTAAGSTDIGGHKSGIAYDYKKPDAFAVLRRFMIAMRPYISMGIDVGDDLGTKYDDIMKVLNEFGLGVPITKAQSHDVDFVKRKKAYEVFYLTARDEEFVFDTLSNAITGFGVAYAVDEAHKIKEGKKDARVVIQGFGAVGTSCAFKLHQLGYQIVGIADANMLVSCKNGLDVERLINGVNQFGEMDEKTFETSYKVHQNTKWLDIDCDILVPAAIENAINSGNADKVKAGLIVEGANIPVSNKADQILHHRGVALVPDFLANMGCIRMVDRLLFGHIEMDVQEVNRDIESICRKNTRIVLEKWISTKKFSRDIAKEIFKPTIQDIYPV